MRAEVLFVAFALGAALPAQSGSDGYRPPGELIDVGGRKLHLYCTGAGTPTVVLVAGGGAFSIDWALVQPRVSEQTRVCSWDRAGLAWSDPGPADETVEGTVADLHAVLQASGEKPPYVLVGASIAGIFIRAYQRTHPDDVAALVFTNSSNRVGMRVSGGDGLIWELREEQIRSAFPLPASAKGPPPASVGEPFDRLPAQLQTTRVWLERRMWERWEPTKTGPDSMLSWRKEFVRVFEETAPGLPPPLGRLPVVVAASGPAGTESDRQSRAGAAARLDFLSSNTTHITSPESGHEMHLYRPDVAVQAITQAVRSARRAPE
jgi:pimeloyl-ACP methyl ester carboxylesterase